MPYDSYFSSDPLLARDPMRLTRNRQLTRITAPATEPVTLSEAKLYLRIDNTDEDSLIGDLIVAARMVAESWLKRSLITQTWKMAFDDGIPSGVSLPMGPVSSIASVIVYSADGSMQTISSNAYRLNASQNALVLDTALYGVRIEIIYNTGYGDATAVPKPIKLGMLEHMAAMYDSRGQSDDMLFPERTIGLYMPFREVRL